MNNNVKIRSALKNKEIISVSTTSFQMYSICGRARLDLFTVIKKIKLKLHCVKPTS